MPKKKTAKKSIKASKKAVRTRPSSHGSKHRAVSFLVGVITLAILALLFFHYTRGNNYKQVLGDEIQLQEQGIYAE